MTSYLEGIPFLQCACDTERSMEETKNLPRLLDLFADFSDLQINHAKLAFLGFGLSQKAQFSGALGMPIRMLRMHYLGLPLTGVGSQPQKGDQ